MRRRLAQAVRRELEQRKRRLAVMTYDDLLTRLNDTLAGPSGPAAALDCARASTSCSSTSSRTPTRSSGRSSTRVRNGGATLVLIADPKQAIYAFRGADVYAYLEAAQSRAHATLRENWRSDQGLIDAYDALFAGAKLGHEGIAYRQVRAAPAHQEPRLPGAPATPRCASGSSLRQEPSIDLTLQRVRRDRSARAHIARDLAADVVALLSSGAMIERRTPDGEPTRHEPICPGHLAVLVRTHATAELIRDALDAASVPAVINGAGSVFATGSARDWLALLEALERPASPVRARTAALTPFLGWRAERIAIAREEEWEEVHRRLHRWAGSCATAASPRCSRRSRSARAWPRACCGRRRRAPADRPAPRRRVAAPRREHRAARTDRAPRLAGRAHRRGRSRRRGRGAQPPAGVRRRGGPGAHDPPQQGARVPRRLLPVPVGAGWIRSKEPVAFHDPATGYKRTVDVGLEGRTFKRHSEQYLIEQRGEDLRLAYVALTRAKHQAVVWWAGTRYSRNSPLARLLFAKDADGVVKAFGDSTPADAAVVERFRELAAAAPGRIAVERSALAGVPAAWSPALEPPVGLQAARFDRRLDLWWRRTSYTDITAEAHDPLVASEPERPVLSDEPETPTPVAVSGAVAPELERESPLGSAPVGVDFGTFVHTVFEATDFAAPDLDAELAERFAGAQSRRALDLGGESDRVVQGLRAAIETPLGPIAGGLRLRDVARTDRLDELEFELPLAGGDSPAGRLTLSDDRRRAAFGTTR